MSNIVLYPTLTETLSKANLACKSCSQAYNVVKPSRLECLHNVCISCLQDSRCPVCPPGFKKIGIGDMSKFLQVREITSTWESRFGSKAESSTSQQHALPVAVAISAQSSVSVELNPLQRECRDFFYKHLLNISKLMAWDNVDNIKADFESAPHHFVFFKNLRDKSFVGFAQIKGTPGNYRVTLGVTDGNHLNDSVVQLLAHLRTKYYHLKAAEDLFVFRFNRSYHFASNFKSAVESENVQVDFDTDYKRSVLYEKIYPLRSTRGVCHAVAAPFESQSTVSTSQAVSSTSLPLPVSAVQSALQEECRSFMKGNLLVIANTMMWDLEVMQTIENEFDAAPHEFVFLRSFEEGLCGFAQIKSSSSGYKITLGLTSRNFMYHRVNELLDFLKNKYFDLTPEEAAFEFRFKLALDGYVNNVQSMFEWSGVKAECIKGVQVIVLVMYPLIRKKGAPYAVLTPFVSESKDTIDVPERWAKVDASRIPSNKLPSIMMLAGLEEIEDPSNIFMMQIDDTEMGFIQVIPDKDSAYRLLKYKIHNDFIHFKEHFLQEFFDWFFTDERNKLIVNETKSKLVKEYAIKFGLKVENEKELCISRYK